MRALIWKELRENILWAALAMLALGAAGIYALHHTQFGGPDYNYMEGITLCKKQFLTVTMFGYAAAGMALGFLQVLPELKPDRWAALLHLPMPRGRFFWGKVIAGLMLYFVAAGVPFFFTVWRVATPGNFPTPFVPKMMTPGLADLTAGLCYYFAALLVALQSGRLAWRALPLFAAVHVSFVALEENLFGAAVAAAVAMALVLCVAGWGAIHSRGTLRARPWLGRMAFLIVAFYGAWGAGDLLQALGGVAGRVGDAKYSYWEVLDDGEPVRLDIVKNVLVAATGVDGKPFTNPAYRPDRVRNHTLGMNTATSYVGDSHGWHRQYYRDDYRTSYHYIFCNQPYEHPRFEQWFYIVEGRHYVGMLPSENREFARIGADGFAPPGASVRGFPKEVHSEQIGSGILAIAAPESLRYADLAKRKISTVTLPAPGPIYGMGNSWAKVPNGNVNFQGIGLGAGMAVCGPEGKVVAMLTYHHDVDRWGQLSLGVLTSMDRFVLKCEPSEWIDEKVSAAMPSYLDVMDAQGALLTSYEMPAPPPGISPQAWNSFIAQRVECPAFFFGRMLYRRIGAALGSERLRDELRNQWGPGYRFTRQCGLILVPVAVLLAAVTFVWARRAQLPPRRVWAWTVGVLFLSLPGFVLFWLAGERPRTASCAACRRPRPIEAERCPHCRAPWPAKPADGTEILQHASAAL